MQRALSLTGEREALQTATILREAAMASIAILTAHAGFPWLRQIPGGGAMVDGWRFTLGDIEADCRFVIVYDEPKAPFATDLPKARRLLITSEPPGMKQYRPGFMAQFGTVLGPVGQAQSGTEWLQQHAALPWFYGVGFTPDGLVANETLDSLAAASPPAKQPGISVVLSKKSNLPKHRARLRFVERLKARLDDRLAIYGRGFESISDKAEAIAPYAYHLVLENNDIAHFWTEKTADAFLGWAMPVFSGCANLDEDFPAGSFRRIDINEPEAAIAAIEALLASQTYAEALPAIREARSRLLDQHNLFRVLARFATERDGTELTKVSTLIRQNSAFAPFPRVTAFARDARRAMMGWFGAGRKSA